MEEGRCSVQAIRWLYVWGWHVVGMLLTCQDILHGRYSWQVGGCRWQIHGKCLVMPGMFLSFTTLSVGIKEPWRTGTRQHQAEEGHEEGQLPALEQHGDAPEHPGLQRTRMKLGESSQTENSKTLGLSPHMVLPRYSAVLQYRPLCSKALHLGPAAD